jgi:hypothetical protein
VSAKRGARDPYEPRPVVTGLVIAVITIFVVAGLALVALFVLVAAAMSNMGSNK